MRVLHEDVQSKGLSKAVLVSWHSDYCSISKCQVMFQESTANCINLIELQISIGNHKFEF